MTRATDVAIIGTGIIGCSIAYYLAKKNVKSVVVWTHSDISDKLNKIKERNVR